LPLLALGLPFIEARTVRARLTVRTIVVLGVLIQLLGISVDHHRFFYQRSLRTFFYYTDRSYYFRHSALLARPGELWETIRDGVPSEAEMFRPGPYSNRLTYAVFGGWGHPELPPPLWMRRYRVFWLPRPWPLWMRTIPPSERPVDMTHAEAILALMVLVGGIAIWRGREPRIREKVA
jgi:hypothetical protein